MIKTSMYHPFILKCSSYVITIFKAFLLFVPISYYFPYFSCIFNLSNFTLFLSRMCNVLTGSNTVAMANWLLRTYYTLTFQKMFSNDLISLSYNACSCQLMERESFAFPSIFTSCDVPKYNF